jgi:hypothetical protein
LLDHVLVERCARIDVGGGLRMRHFGGPQGAGPRKDDGGQWRAP